MADAITRNIIVKASPEQVYRMWSNFEIFPLFMKHIKSITVLDARRSHWVMQGPLGTELEWDAEITRNEPNKRIAWRSSEESNMKTSGQVTFNPLSHGETEITAMIHYEPPGGAIGKAVAELFNDPENRLDEDLRNFKSVIEGRQENVTANRQMI